MADLIDARVHVVRPAGRYRVAPTDRTGHAIHHSVSGMHLGPASSMAQEIEHIKSIDRYHNSPPERDWGGFGYMTATFPSGRSYLVGDWDGARAHVSSRNHELVGSVAIGDFSSAPAGASILQGLADCVKAARQHFGRVLELRGHGQWALPQYPSSCPGKIRDQIAQIAALASKEEVTVSLDVPLYQMEGRPHIFADFGPYLVHVTDGAMIKAPSKRLPKSDPIWKKPTICREFGA